VLDEHHDTRDDDGSSGQRTEDDERDLTTVEASWAVLFFFVAGCRRGGLGLGRGVLSGGSRGSGGGGGSDVRDCGGDHFDASGAERCGVAVCGGYEVLHGSVLVGGKFDYAGVRSVTLGTWCQRDDVENVRIDLRCLVDDLGKHGRGQLTVVDHVQLNDLPN